MLVLALRDATRRLRSVGELRETRQGARHPSFTPRSEDQRVQRGRVRDRSDMSLATRVLPVLTCFALGCVTGSSAAERFDTQSRFRLAEARVRGEASVALVIATRTGEISSVVAAVGELRGKIVFRNDEVGYLRTVVPIERVEELMRHVGVQAAEINEPPRLFGSSLPAFRIDDPIDPDSAIRHADEDPSIGRKLELSWPPIPSDFPFRHPYSPLGDLAADAWRRDHPTWDGRGVTIGSVEQGAPDFLLPELQYGLTLDGRKVPKFVDIRNYVDPATPATGQQGLDVWVEMEQTAKTIDGRIEIGGILHAAPRNGRFRVGVIDLNTIAWGYKGRPFNPNHWGKTPPQGEGGLVGLIWDETENLVWVDTDQDRDFSDELPLADYPKRHDYGVFGRDDPTTAVRETIGFTVKTNAGLHRVALCVGMQGHQTMVLGSAAAFRGTDGHVEGVAPGARVIVTGSQSWVRSDYIENYITTFLDPQVDVVTSSQATYGNRLRDGSTVSAIVLARLQKLTGKLYVSGAGNGMAFGQAGGSDDGAHGVLSIGAYQSGESYAHMKGFIPKQRDNLHTTSAVGPGGSGAMKPDLLAPSGHLSLSPAFLESEARNVRSFYRLPPGYAIGGGTSQATPVAAGCIALLLSAAKQNNVPHDGERVRTALCRGARFIEDLPANVQGNGLIQVSAAWQELCRYAKQWNPLRIEIRAPVKTGMSGHLAPPDTGSGLLEMGWRVGQRGTRMISFRRTNGPEAAMTYGLRWLGNDRTFKCADSITLPRDRWVELPVAIAPTAPGARTAVLELVNPAGDDALHRVSCAVAVSEAFTDNAAEIQLSLERPGFHSRFLDVPPGTGALKLEFSGPVAGWFMIELLTPQGRGVGSMDVDFAQMGSRELPLSLVRAPLTVTRIVPNPEPGVWTLAFNSAFREVYNPAHPRQPREPLAVKVKATLLGATINSDGSVATAENERAQFTGTIDSCLASGRRTSLRLARGEQRIVVVEVPEGTTVLAAKLRSPDDGRADVYIYAFDCHDLTKPTVLTDPERVLWGADKSLWIPNPRVGTWKFVVDAAEVPPTGIEVDFIDLVVNSSYGAVANDDTATRRGSGVTWRSSLHAWNTQRIPAGRDAFVVLAVEDKEITSVENSVLYAGARQPLAWTFYPLAK
jgi:hypothetical protein